MRTSIVIVVEDRDISVHPNFEHAESFLEPIDVKDNIYTAYDGGGNLLDLSVVVVEKQHSLAFFKWKTRSEVIRIKLHQPLENREEDLRGKLLEYLGNRDNKGDGQLSTVELTRLVSKYMPWRLDA